MQTYSSVYFVFSFCISCKYKMKPILVILFIVTFARFNHALEFFECDDSKGNGFQPSDCVITGIHLVQNSKEKYAFSPKGLMTSLRFVNSELSYIPREMFKQMPMRNLYIEAVGLQELSPFVFRLANELRELHAANNYVTKINRNTFYGVESIRMIDLSNNKLSFVHPDAFYNLTALRWISLANNNLRKLSPEWFMYSDSFVHINMRYNKFDTVELDFSDMVSLTDLDLSGKEGVGTPMKELTIHLNCTYMTNLDVSYNTALQKLIVTCSTQSLQNVHLYAHDTSLGVGPRPALEIDPLLNIHVLTLDNTLYYDIGELVPYAGSLRQLSLERNAFKKLNEVLTNFTDLHKLSLKGNGPQAVDISLIKQLQNLRALNLANTGLTSLDIKSFGTLQFLRDLNLADNLLTTLSVEEILETFPALEYLDIKGNRFSPNDLNEMVEAFDVAGVVVNF